MESGGITDLNSLIGSMKPSLDTETYVFGHIPAASDSASQSVMKMLIGMPVQMLYKEDEGWTVIMAQDVAESIQLKSTFPCKRITLNVHSSLDAVGFLAKVLENLATLGVGVNPVSGFFHDHLFVPVGKEDEVMEALQNMAAETAGVEGF